MLVLEDISRDQIYMYYVLVQSIPALIYRYLPSRTLKCYFATVMGVGFLILLMDINAIHIFIITLVSGILVTRLRPNKHLVFAVATFNVAYLLFFWLKEEIGLPPNPSGHSTIAQALASLKMIGLSTELFDLNELEMKVQILEATPDRSENIEEELRKAKLEHEFRKIKPTILNIFHYSFCIIGMTGMVYKYRTYVDMLQAPFAQRAPTWSMLLHRAKSLIIFFPIYMFLKKILNGGVWNDAVGLIPELWPRLWKTALTVAYCRVIIYIGATMFECTCILTHCGVYPKESGAKPGHGPTNFDALLEKEKGQVEEFSWDTVRSYIEMEVEFCPSIRQTIRHWNMTVQYWIFRVYREIPNRLLGGVIVFSMSAFFHGLDFGFYVTFLTMPAVLLAEQLFTKAFKRYYPRLFTGVNFVMKHVLLLYFCVPFLMRSFNNTMVFLTSTYFLGHFVVLFIMAISYAWLCVSPPQTRIKELV